MARGCCFAFFLALSVLMNAFCLPPSVMFRERRDTSDNQVGNKESSSVNDTIAESKDTSKDASADDTKDTATSDDHDDFNDDDFKPTTTSNGGGSNILSLLNLATALLPSLSGNNNVKKNNAFVTKTIRDIIKQYQARTIQKRKDIKDNVIEIDYASELKPPFFERQETEETDDDDDDDDDESSESESEEDNAAEESVEEATTDNGDSTPKQDSGSNASTANDDNDSDYDEPNGDGQGGGILGLLSGLSGDGESDLGSLLAAVGGIVANLSGDGVDINALIATGLGLFVGLLSDEGSNPGEIIASYLLTSLDTITGGGSQNNGAFFGKFLSTLVKGTSAAQKSDESTPSFMQPFMAFKMDMFRALVQFGTSMIGLASSATTGGT